MLTKQPLDGNRCWKKKKKVGLVIRDKYSAMTTNQEIIRVHNNKLHKRKEKYKQLEMKFETVNLNI